MKIATPPLEDAACDAVRLDPALQKVEAAGMPGFIEKLELRGFAPIRKSQIPSLAGLEYWNDGIMGLGKME